MDDYYAYTPLLRLERPLALVGAPGAAVERTARAVNLLSGLPLVAVDRRVEHLLGRSVELVQLESGSTPRTETEAGVLREAVAARTKPIVALTDVTYTDDALQALVETEMDVVLLHLDLADALERVAAEAVADRRKHYALTQAGRASPDEVRAALEVRLARYRHLARVVPVAGRAPLEVAQGLLADLGMVT
ncbi:MAG: hypothetical protein H6733_14175 [Alphaproteobacteria bacterium]|nr:hypothetical protein [Alphaproteobacteria bacterium]